MMSDREIQWLHSWFVYLDHKLDSINKNILGNMIDDAKLRQLKSDVEAKAAELKAVVEANQPKVP